MRATIGTTMLVLALMATATQSARSQTLTTLHNFKGPPDGQNPYAVLLSDPAGNLYGTTLYGGGADFDCPGADTCGAVFKVSASDKETVLHRFTGGSDGGNPYSGLVRDAAGNLYGASYDGGSVNCQAGCGVVFKMSKNGKETVLHAFEGGTTDGCDPAGELLRDNAGNLYGIAGCGAYNYGLVYKLDSKGHEKILYNFSAYPGGGLLLAGRGNFYGLIAGGGNDTWGAVYTLTKSGRLSILYSFNGGTNDGCFPLGTPAMDANGNLYGTTNQCGSANYGTVWKLNTDHTETVLHNFTDEPSDGALPFAGVILDTDVNIYGGTFAGGASNYGTVYRLDANGNFTLLHSFAGSDGASPRGGVIRDKKGNLYGTSVGGGTGPCREGCGTVWELKP